MGGGVTYSFLFPLLEDILEFEDDKVKRKVNHANTGNRKVL